MSNLTLAARVFLPLLTERQFIRPKLQWFQAKSSPIGPIHAVTLHTYQQLYPSMMATNFGFVPLGDKLKTWILISFASDPFYAAIDQHLEEILNELNYQKVGKLNIYAKKGMERMKLTFQLSEQNQPDPSYRGFDLAALRNINILPPRFRYEELEGAARFRVQLKPGTTDGFMRANGFKRAVELPGYAPGIANDWLASYKLPATPPDRQDQWKYLMLELAMRLGYKHQPIPNGFSFQL